MRRLLPAAATTVAMLLTPVVAHAGTPITLGNANHSNPTVTAGGGGVFHVVFNDPGAFVYRYCQIKLPSLACVKTAIIPFNDNPPSQDQTSAVGAPDTAWIIVDPDGGPIRLVNPQYVSGATYESISIDGGSTFSPLQRVHKRGNRIGSGRPILEDDRSSILVPRAGLDGPVLHESGGSESVAEAQLDAGGVNLLSYNPSVANVTGSTVTTADDLDNAYFWRAADGLPLSAAPSWGTASLISPGTDSTMAGGGGTAYIAATNFQRDGRPLEIRRWGGMAFGAPAVVFPTQGYVTDLTVTPGGTPGVVFRDNTRGLLFASPDAKGKYDPKTIVHDDEIFGDVNVAYDDTGQGLAVWPRDGAIAAADVTEVADPSTPLKSVTVTKNKLTLGVNVPGSGLLPGKKTRVTTSGQGYAKVKTVKFTFGAQKATDKTNPFSASFTVPKSSAKGARIAVTATAFVVRKTAPKAFTVKINSFVDVCGG